MLVLVNTYLFGLVTFQFAAYYRTSKSLYFISVYHADLRLGRI